MGPKPGITVQTIVVTGLAIALVVWGAMTMWPQLRNDLFPWWRDPARVAVAVGWTDRLPEVPGVSGCVPTAEAGSGLVAKDGGVFLAASRGEVKVPCADGSLLLEVQRVAKLSVVPPPSLRAGETATVRLMAYDLKGQQLRVGALANVEWRAEPPLRLADSAPQGDAVRITADAPGEGTVQATFDTLVGRVKVVVP